MAQAARPSNPVPSTEPRTRNTEPMRVESGTRAVLRERNLVWFVASRFFSATAATLLAATFAWQIFAITGSAFYLGLMGLAEFAPTLLLSLVAGAVADRYDRRHLIMLAQ